MSLENMNEEMTKVIENLQDKFSEIRAGRANPAVLNRVTVDYYGAQTPINQVASVSVPEARLIVIQPWDKTLLSPIQKARIVRVLKQNGNVVGYMGDGINDSPALTNSDVGISVDTAVDIAKETADIILLEKDLNVLLDGVMERKKNICKFNEIYKNGNKLQLWGSSFSNYCKHCITIFT